MEAVKNCFGPSWTEKLSQTEGAFLLHKIGIFLGSSTEENLAIISTGYLAKILNSIQFIEGYIIPSLAAKIDLYVLRRWSNKQF